ncbi:hypothetical protein LVD15_15625 [Fulvivirga maritima]|uniref:glycosyltransferase n=1 Tax=Fulvivirga maritima TaxID=2904247 RepID=UPI001F483C95|nr:glycosyltransferase [Fulvivirga maritima]UII24740.1 hypothetical protein LVD15_15625 [Fulvivirga maritima]
MHKFMIVVPPFFGHISPTLSLGAELISRGHEVVWVGLKPIDQKQVPEKGRFLVPEELEDHQEELLEILGKQDKGPSLSKLETLKLALEETYVPFCHLLMPGLTRLVEEWEPDVIIHDELIFAAPILAVNKGIPYVTTIAVPPKVIDRFHIPKIENWVKGHTFGVQKAYGIDLDKPILRSEELCIVSTSPEFADASGLGKQYKFVGPLIKGRPNSVTFDWERLDKASSPKIYVSIGTLLEDIRKKFFSKVVEAFADSPYTFVCATNPDIIEEWPDNFIVQSYVPQSEIIPKMNAVICHGGFNTVNETFYHGLPMVITPIAYDQFYIASLVKEAGCGIDIRYKRLRIDALKQALDQILEPGNSYKKEALKIQASLKDCGGAEAAASHVEQFAADKRPATVL